MTRSVRLVVFAIGVVGFAVMFLAAVNGMPDFGGTAHPYRDLAVPAALLHNTANTVTSVVFDARGIDTLVEEMILFASVIAVAALLRPAEGEEKREPHTAKRKALEAVRLIGFVFLPLTLIVGLDVVAHGHVTPGGGFQGGVILATGVHLTYLSGSYRALDRIRPLDLFETSEALGAAAFALLGVAAIGTSGAFLANFLSTGTLGGLLSSGTVAVFNGAVGIAVASSMVVALASFFDQALVIEETQK